MDDVARADPAGRSELAQRTHRERLLANLAAQQGGVVSRAQLGVCGFGLSAIDHRVARGALHVVHRGVYAVGHDWVLGLGLEHAALLAIGDEAVRGVRSAAAARNLMSWPSRTVEVIAPRSRRSRPGIRVYTFGLAAADVSMLDGLPTTTVERTLFDLAEVLPAEPFKRAWEKGVRDDLINLRALRAVAARNRGRHGLKVIRPRLETPALPGIADTRSPLEVDFVEFAALHLARFGPPSINYPFGDFVLDVYYGPGRLAVELDSREHHLNPIAFETDRAKQAACLAGGVVIFPLTSRRLRMEPLKVAEQLTSTLLERWLGPPPRRCAS